MFYRKTALGVMVLLSLAACTSKGQNEQETLIVQSLENMIYVPGGTFMMGDGAFTEDVNGLTTDQYWTNWNRSKPAHEVTLDTYYLGKFEVTFNEFDVYSRAKEKTIIYEHLAQQGRRDGYPAVITSWYEAKAYCTWLGEISSLPFDLPTEAQWEYAARNRGKNYLFPTNNGKIEARVNIKVMPEGSRYYSPVGVNPPNPMGFYEMGASVREWVEDWYDFRYYQYSPKLNPKGPAESPYKNNKSKVFRGTSNGNSGSVVRNFMVFKRGDGSPEETVDIGVRCALHLEEQLTPNQLKDRALDYMRRSPSANENTIEQTFPIVLSQ